MHSNISKYLKSKIGVNCFQVPITPATSLYPLLKYLTNTKEIKNASEETTKALIKNAFTSLNVHKKGKRGLKEKILRASNSN